MTDTTGPDFSTTIDIDRPPREVFDAINQPRRWWSDSVHGEASRLGDQFVFDGADHHFWTFRVTELVPGERIIWRVTDSTMNWVQDTNEWTGTDIRFELTETDAGSRLHFVHVGLTPTLECFAGCSYGWTGYITDSLPCLVTTGDGRPARISRRGPTRTAGSTGRRRTRHRADAGAAHLPTRHRGRPQARAALRRRPVMPDETADPRGLPNSAAATASRPEAVDRATFQSELDRLRIREKAHTHEGDAIAAARRRLPAVEVDPHLALIGPDGPVTLLDAFEGRRQLIAYHFMWNPGRPAPEQCEGCTFYTSQVGELSYLHSRNITYAVFCQGRNLARGPGEVRASYDESLRYREFLGWDMPWYSAQPSLEALLADRELGLFHLICYLRDDDRVFETYWTKRRGVEAMDYSYALMDLTPYGRQEPWEDSPADRPQQCSNVRTAGGSPWPPVSQWSGGRPIAQWPRLDAGRSDHLATTTTTKTAAQPHRCH